MRIRTSNPKQEFVSRFQALEENVAVLEEIYKTPEIQKYILKEQLPGVLVVKRALDKAKREPSQPDYEKVLQQLERMQNEIRHIKDHNSSDEDDEPEEPQYDDDKLNRFTTMLGLNSVKSSNNLFVLLHKILDSIRQLSGEVDKLQSMVSSANQVQIAKPSDFVADLYLSESERRNLSKGLINLNRLIQIFNAWKDMDDHMRNVKNALHSIDLVLCEGKVDRAMKDGIMIGGKSVSINEFQITDLATETDHNTLALINKDKDKCALSIAYKESIICMRTYVRHTPSGMAVDVRVFWDGKQFEQNYSAFKNKNHTRLVDDHVSNFSGKSSDTVSQIKQKWQNMDSDYFQFLLYETLEAYIHLYAMLFHDNADFAHSVDTYFRVRNQLVPYNSLPTP